MLYQNVGTVEPWHKKDRRFLGDNNLLIIGNGNIGKRVANKMVSFLQISTFDAIQNLGNDLESKIRNADIITIHIPSSHDNKNFFDKRKLSWMKDGAILINTSRGQIVSENALYKEIESERLRAAFDVYWEEPYNGILKQFHPDKFYMTPHIASTCSRFLSGLEKDLTDVQNLNQECMSYTIFS